MEKSQPKATSTIIMQHIPMSFDEHELLSELSIAKVPVQEIRMSHRRNTVTNLQTAYIEFNTVEEAQQWMTLTQVQTKDLNSSIILVLYLLVGMFSLHSHGWQ